MKLHEWSQERQDSYIKHKKEMEARGIEYPLKKPSLELSAFWYSQVESSLVS